MWVHERGNSWNWHDFSRLYVKQDESGSRLVGLHRTGGEHTLLYSPNPESDALCDMHLEAQRAAVAGAQNFEYPANLYSAFLDDNEDYLKEHGLGF